MKHWVLGLYWGWVECLYYSSNNIQSTASVDVPGFGEPRKSACLCFFVFAFGPVCTTLSTYSIFVGPPDEDYYNEMGHSGRSKTILLGNLCNNGDGDFQVMFPNDIQKLFIYKCSCDVSSLIGHSIELEVINIEDCNSMESLISSSWFCPSPTPFPSYNGVFSSLKEFNCFRCSSMKKLFPFVLLPNLVNLEEIKVRECEKMEEIIGGTRSDKESSINNTEFKLPK